MTHARAAALAFLFLLAGVPSPAVAQRAAVNWPQFRFDQRHDGANPFETALSPKTAPRLRLHWQARLGRLVDGSSPVAVDGVVYIGSSDGVLWAYPAGGCGQALCTTPLWRSVGLGQIVDTPTVANGFVYVGSQTSVSSNDGKLDVFSAAGCGSSVCPPLWQGMAGTESILQSSPTVAGGTVLVGAFDGRLYAFPANGCGAATCQPRWTGQTGGTVESTPTVANGVAYVGSDDGSLYAFDAKGCGGASCRPLWTGAIGSPPFDSTPAVVSGTVYIAGQHDLVAFDANGCGAGTCQPLWDGHSTSFFGGSPAVSRGRVYVGLESELAVFDANGCGAASCQPLWMDFASGAQASILSSPTVAHGVVYVGRNTAEVLTWRAGPCGQPVCSHVLWRGLTNDQIVNSSPTVVNGTVYIGSADNLFPEDQQGRLYVFDLPAIR